MIRKHILQAEPWTIFLVFFASVLLYAVIPQENIVLNIMATCVLYAGLTGWLLVIGISLNRNVAEADQRDEKVFVFSWSYCFLVTVISGIDPSFLKEIDISYVLVFSGLYCFCFFYVLYFCSITFLENQETLPAKDRLSSSLVFITFIVFVAGVFVLQPRIKRIFAQ